MIRLTEDQAKKLTTERLLAYYKKNSRSYAAKYLCNDSKKFFWEVNSKEMAKEMKKAFLAEKSYWINIKSLLDTKENVK